MHRQVTLFLAALLAVACSVILHGADHDANDLSATADSQRLQNQQADAQDLSRMQDDAMVRRFRRLALLVPVRPTDRYYLQSIPAKFQYLRPWARLFLNRLGREYHARFGVRLRVTGLLRTVHYQQALDARNPNAAPALGEERSTHLTGATLDLSKRFMSQREIDWTRRVLAELRGRSVLYAIEEFTQPCFHVMVYRSYVDYVREIQ